MAGQTPPRIDDAQKNFIGVGTRELVIAVIGIVLAALIFMTKSIMLPIRVALAILVAGAGIGIAFGRDQKSGRRFEEMITQILMFYGRDKFHQKGAAHVEPGRPMEPVVEKPKKEAKAYFRVQPIDLSVIFLLQLFSIAFLGALLTYIWGGGLDELLRRYKPTF